MSPPICSQPLAPDSGRHLRQIRYVSTGTISLAYKRDEIRPPAERLRHRHPAQRKTAHQRHHLEQQQIRPPRTGRRRAAARLFRRLAHPGDDG